MNDDNDYTPIDCDVYSEYEVSILHRQRLRVRWRDDGGADHVETLRPTDLETREGKEFMTALTDHGEERRIRLDRIREAGVLKGTAK